MQNLSKMSIMDCQLLRQQFRQKISLVKTNTSDDITKIVHFGIEGFKKHKCLF